MIHVLRDLTGATIEYRWDRKRTAGVKVTLVASACYTDGELVVRLDPIILELFKAATWNINLAQRARLREGLESWLYTFVRASTTNFLQDLEIGHLHALSRSPKQDLREFGRDLKQALEKLKTEGLIENYGKTSRSAYTITRKRRAAKIAFPTSPLM